SQLKAPEDIENGANRRCTDVLFMLILVLEWIVMTALGAESISTGDPRLLVNGIDYNGRICGVDSDVAEKSKLYYIRFDGTGVCVESCPTDTDWAYLWACTDDTSSYTVNEGFNCTASISNTADCLSLADLSAAGSSSFDGGGLGECMFQIKSTDFINHCVFSDSDVLENFVNVGGGDVTYLSEFVSDIYTARAWILGFGFGFSLILCFIYVALLRMPGMVCLLVWGSILTSLVLFLAIGYASLSLASNWTDDGEHTTLQIISCKALGYIAFAGSFLFACLVIFLRKQINLATCIVKESARAIGRMPTMVMMPFIQCVTIIAFLVPWVIYSVYTASIAEISTNEVAGLSVRSFEYEQDIELRGWFLLFVFFWTTQFIIAMGQIIISLTIVKYYFSRNDQDVNNGTFWKSLKEGIYYHMGTAALGSLIIAIMIRTVITYWQKKLSKSGNKLAEAILCCLSSCIWCLEKCMKFINKNAYVAIFSTSFCTSAKNSFWLIARNLGRIGAVSVITQFVVFILKLVICLGTAGAIYLALEANMSEELYSPIGPVIFAGIIAYAIASTFSTLVDMVRE
ncbi:unnamed protein product, partial [Choristocarpus tenellus]